MRFPIRMEINGISIDMIFFSQRCFTLKLVANKTANIARFKALELIFSHEDNFRSLDEPLQSNEINDKKYIFCMLDSI